MIVVKRIYAPAEASDGTRILVDRLWPRGLNRAQAHLDAWVKDIAPSRELRLWYRHRPELWPEFQRRYRSELESEAAARALAGLCDLARIGRLTLLTAARSELNHAVVLRGIIMERQDGGPRDQSATRPVA